MYRIRFYPRFEMNGRNDKGTTAINLVPGGINGVHYGQEEVEGKVSEHAHRRQRALGPTECNYELHYKKFMFII